MKIHSLTIEKSLNWHNSLNMVSFQCSLVNCRTYSIAAAIRAGESYAVAVLLKDMILLPWCT